MSNRTGLSRADFERLQFSDPDPFGRDPQAALVELQLRGYAACQHDLARIEADQDGGYSAAAVDRLADLLEAEVRFTPIAGACRCYAMTYADFLEQLQHSKRQRCARTEPQDIFAVRFVRDNDRGARLVSAETVSGEAPETREVAAA